jgi:hypothetical protein
VCGPARAKCVRAIAQTIGVVADFGMVNYPPDLEFRCRTKSPLNRGVRKGSPTTILCRWRRALKPPRHTLLGCPARGNGRTGQDSILKVEWAALNAQARPLNRSLPDYRRVL